MIFSADFETTTDPNDCRVWAVGLFEIFSKDNFIYSNNIDYLFEFLNTIEFDCCDFENAINYRYYK